MFEGIPYYAPGVFKNPTKIGCMIPDMTEIPIGEHKLFIDISFNGQQYTNSGNVILYQCNLSFKHSA